MRAAKKSPTDAVLNLALKDKLSKLSTDGKTSIPEKLPECKKSTYRKQTGAKIKTTSVLNK